VIAKDPTTPENTIAADGIPLILQRQMDMHS